MQFSKPNPKHKGPNGKSFLGSAVAKYDIDELDDLQRRPKKEQYVEVKRPDGSVAKSRGERTFYGAFTGGFSAGYWGTVGSKEGWEPASFSSSRSKRNGQSELQVEDFMDEEDLREHRSSHKTFTARSEFASNESRSARALEGRKESILPGGLPRELEEEIFIEKKPSLGSRLLRAASIEDVGNKAKVVPIATGTSVSSTSCEAPEEKQSQSKKSYGCVRPPAGFKPQAVEPVQPRDQVEEDVGVGLTPVLRKRPNSDSATASKAEGVSNGRRLEADLERLWRSKTDLHGVGYNLGSLQSSSMAVPTGRRLYMSNQRGRNLASADKALGYGNFGTGILDQDDYDVWEEIYDHHDKHSQYHAALRDEDVEEESRTAALEDVRSKVRTSARNAGAVAGFVLASRPDQEPVDFSEWFPPPVPKGYRGIHMIQISPVEEAEHGSSEHKQLQDFLEKHGSTRLLNPRYRAELLGERTRGNTDDGVEKSSSSTAPAHPTEATGQMIVQDASAPLWKSVSDTQKQNLLSALGRNFVVGQTQDMEGATARHEPFKSDPQKQKRYTRFCLALEGKTSASEALRDTGGLTEAAREAELAEFGRVYRSFRQQHPEVDLAKALEEKAAVASLAPVLKRSVQTWRPEKLLCRRWGVPEPKPITASGFSDSSTAGVRPSKQQQKYLQQVQAGLAKVMANAPSASATGTSPASSSTTTPAITSSLSQAGPAGDPPRPPKSLFTSIFGVDNSDDEL